MSESSPVRVLIVANRTAATPGLIDAVRERAHESPCSFTLLVPQLAAEVEFGEEEPGRPSSWRVRCSRRWPGDLYRGSSDLPMHCSPSSGRSFTSTSTR